MAPLAPVQSTSSSTSHNGHFSMSSVDAFSYIQPLDFATPPVPTQSERTGRRTYKTTKEKKETVWPPYLEAALLEALALYRPASKSGRKLKRFTKRNCFIAKHIFRTTGAHRTPKQVGSRLQQIRESSEDEAVLKLVMCRDFPPESGAETDDVRHTPGAGQAEADREWSPSSSSKSTCTPALSFSSSISEDLRSPTLSPINCSFEHPNDNFSVSVELLPSESNDQVALSLDLAADITDRGVDFLLNISPFIQPNDHRSFFNAPRVLNVPSHCFFRSLPDITLTSSLLLPTSSYGSMFSVYFDGTTLASDHTMLTAVKSDSGCLAYTSPFTPSYWENLITDSSIDRYTIIQDIMELVHPVDTPNNHKSFDNALDFKLKFSIEYRFRCDSSSQGSPELFNPTTSPRYPRVFENLDFNSPTDNSLFLHQRDSPIQTSQIPNGTIPSWCPHNLAAPTSAFATYDSFGDSSLLIDPSDLLPAYAFPSFY